MMEDYEKLASDVSVKHDTVQLAPAVWILCAYVYCQVSFFSPHPCLLLPNPAAGMDPSHHPLAAEPRAGEDCE